MNYQKIYENLVSNAKQQNRVKLPKDNSNYIYFENHHINPRSLGGGNEKENLVLLTAKEHFIAHKLLILFHKGKNKRKMSFALHRLTYSKNYGHFKCSKDYKYVNEILSVLMTGKNNPMYNKIVSEETRQKLSNAGKGHLVYWKDLTTYWKGRIKSEDHLRKISESLKGKKAWNEGKKLAHVYNAKLGKSTQILLEELNLYLQMGWIPGRGGSYKKRI
jgi:hypothetical protein